MRSRDARSATDERYHRRAMNDCLALRGISKSYEAGIRGCSATVRVLRELDLDVSAGEIVAVSAAPSAGKTTLLLCGAGLLRPDRGSVSWFGRPPRRDASNRPDGIAYASDRPFPYAFLSVREALEYAAIVRDLPLGDSSARVAQALERTNLAAVAHRRVDALNAAQLSRMALAGALLARPRLLLVDDLSSGGDSATAHELLCLVRSAAADGAGVVVAGRLVAWLAATDVGAQPRARTRFVSLVGGRIEAPADEPIAVVPRAPGTLAPARVAELPQPSTARHNEAR
jgi:ABC-type multidrug transport system ATPase subunit